jgi:hypothetical protein
MPAQIGLFPPVVAVRGLPDRGSSAICGGPFSIITLRTGLRPAHNAIQYRRGITRTGELDGAKEADGG